MASDTDLVEFLQWALPRLGMRWPGFRRVRRQVGRRIRRRMEARGVVGLAAYRALLEEDAAEWAHLDTACRVTISRFHRDRGVFEALAARVLPVLAAGVPRGGTLAAWSVGCASGEEAHSVALAWRLDVVGRFPEVRLDVLGTDTDEHLLARAERACYPESSLRELPEAWRRTAFERVEGGFVLDARYRRPVTFRREDVRHTMPAGPYHLVLCRNLVFTYYALDLQRRILAGLRERVLPGGALVVGIHEGLPDGVPGFAPWSGERAIHRRVAGA